MRIKWTVVSPWRLAAVKALTLVAQSDLKPDLAAVAPAAAKVGMSLTPGCQIGYMDCTYTGCHRLNRVLTAK
jgi:hypothetical protein